MREYKIGYSTVMTYSDKSEAIDSARYGTTLKPIYQDLVDLDIAIDNIARVYNTIQQQESINKSIDMVIVHCGTAHCIAGWCSVVFDKPFEGCTGKQEMLQALQLMWPIWPVFYMTHLSGGDVMIFIEDFLKENGYVIQKRLTTIQEPVAL